MVLKKTDFYVSTFGRSGGLEKTALLTVSTLGGGGDLERTDL